MPVSELILYYLWLVIPFYTTMKGFTINSYQNSPYIWTTNIVADNAISSQADYWGTSTHLSKFLKEFSCQFIGVEINNYMWHHMAIAIARHFLRRCNEILGNTTNDSRLHSENWPVDDPWDTQANHSTHTAERIYAWHGLLIPSVNADPGNRVTRLDKDYCSHRRLRLRRLMCTNLQCCPENFMKNTGAE